MVGVFGYAGAVHNARVGMRSERRLQYTKCSLGRAREGFVVHEMHVFVRQGNRSSDTDSVLECARGGVCMTQTSVCARVSYHFRCHMCHTAGSHVKFLTLSTICRNVARRATFRHVSNSPHRLGLSRIAMSGSPLCVRIVTPEPSILGANRDAKPCCLFDNCLCNVCFECARVTPIGLNTAAKHNHHCRFRSVFLPVLSVVCTGTVASSVCHTDAFGRHSNGRITTTSTQSTISRTNACP